MGKVRDKLQFEYRMGKLMRWNEVKRDLWNCHSERKIFVLYSFVALLPALYRNVAETVWL